MANLRCSAAEESEDTLNSFTSHTGYEPKLLTFGELNDSSVPFSFMIPSTDQDVDDVTLGEMLTAAHRGQVEYCVPGGMSVSQSSSAMFDGSGQPDGERMVDQSGKSGVTFNVISAQFNLHSIINNGLIPGGQNSSKRQAVFFLPIDPRDKGHQDPATIDFNKPRRAQYMQSAWKKHQDAVFLVDIDLAIKKGLTFYQTRSTAIILQGTLPAYCIPKVVRLKTGEVLYEKSYMSPRPPPKISLRHDHNWTRGKVQLGSTVEQQPEDKVVRQSRGDVQHETFSLATPQESRGSGLLPKLAKLFLILVELARFLVAFFI